MRLALMALALGACAEPAIEMKLVLPADAADFDLSCVTAVDLLPIATGDTQTLDIGERGFTDNIPCVDLAEPVTSFAQLQAAIAGRFDLALPQGGLGAVEIRGRIGSCKNVPAQFESVFYGGATYTDGDRELSVPLAHNLSCNATAQFDVHPVKMYELFSTKTCQDYVDPNATVFSGDVRPTLIASQPITYEDGASFKPMEAATEQVTSFSAAYKGTCAAMGLSASTLGGISCINVGGPSACAGSSLELALLPYSYASASIDPVLRGKYLTWGFLGVWSGTAAGPVAGATIAFDEGDDGTIVYGELGTAAFVPNASATATTTSGMAMIYSDRVVGVTVTAPGKPSRHLWIGGDPQIPSSAIAALD